MKPVVVVVSTRSFLVRDMQKENKLIDEQDFPPEKIAIVNRILKECVKLELFKSENELDEVFDALSSLDLHQLNQILDDKIYKSGVGELIQFSKK